MLGISKHNISDDSYVDKMNSVKVLQTPWAAKLISYWLMGIFGIMVMALFLPWQQNIRANGEVTTFLPSDRPQTVNTTIAGRIKSWKVREGQLVAQGDTILELTEVKEKFFDPELLRRTAEQIQAKKDGIVAKEDKIAALEAQYNALAEGLRIKLDQIAQKIAQKRMKVQSDSITLEAARVDFAIALRQLQGTQVMFDSGVVALVKLESARSKFQKAQSELLGYENKYASAQNDLTIEQLSLQTIRAEALEKMAKSRSDRSATVSDLQDAIGSLVKLQNEYANLQIRNQQYAVLAPQAGYVVKTLRAGIGEMVKEGEAVSTIMPSRPKKAVALYVKAMDVSLLDTGRHVRLQFDGWPALQFSGWPSVSVGTFGGKVQVIDYVDSKPGKYRILITEDVNFETEDEPWPDELRMGSGVFGWVMLDNVSVWYEIWRQLNGFPPTVEAYEERQQSGKGKGKDEDKDDDKDK